jgi:hypothetical protein
MSIRAMGPAAALVGVLPTVQPQGVWTGRRQLVVRFAGEAETAVMYSAAALAEEMRRLAGRATFHSIALAGRDPLGNVECLEAALAQAALPLPVLAETDGQRPEAVRALAQYLTLVQVTTDGTAPAPALGRIHATLGAAAELGLEHALVLAPGEHTTDAQLLRLIEQAHAVSERVAVVIHPDEPVGVGPLDPRWSEVLAQATGLHGDVRLLRRLGPPPSR